MNNVKFKMKKIQKIQKPAKNPQNNIQLITIYYKEYIKMILIKIKLKAI